MEHRWGDRTDVTVRVWIDGAFLSGAGTLRNLSSSGAYIETSLPLSPLTMVRIRLPDSNQGPLTDDDWGLVVRQDSGGIGVEWCDAAAPTIKERPHSNSFAVAP
ncbi:MAG TPA: hypothetical protein VN645_11600 [Steroidobacteraceae bacterium]|nr:hypothetical protein [Steroidobacteraceae bacterium]